MCEQSFPADNVARRVPLKVSADQWRVPTEEKEGKEKKKRERIYLLPVLRVHNENNQRYEWTPRYTLAIRSSGFLQGPLKVWCRYSEIFHGNLFDR